jgi:hypothetical protein
MARKKRQSLTAFVETLIEAEAERWRKKGRREEDEMEAA